MRINDKDGARMRAAPRIKIFQAGEIRCGSGETRRVHLLNISTGGALLYADSAPGVGEQVRVACGIPLGIGRVQWTSGQRFGVAFAHPITSAQIDRVIRKQDDRIEAPARRHGAFG